MEKQIVSSAESSLLEIDFTSYIQSLSPKQNNMNNNNTHIYSSRSLLLTIQKLKNSSCLIFITTQ